MASGPCGIPAFEGRVGGSVCASHQHPARFFSPCSRGDDRFEIVGCVEHLRLRHESSLFCRKVGREVLMKLRRVEISETVRRLLYRSRLAEVTWETLSIVGLILSSVWHVGSDIYQPGTRWSPSGFGNCVSATTGSDKKARSILLSEPSFFGTHICLKGLVRPLDDP